MLKKFTKYYIRHKGLFILDTVSSLGVAILDLIVPFLTRNIINVYLPNNDMKGIINVGIILLIIAIISLFLNFIINYYGHVMGTKIERDMREDLFIQFQRMDDKFFATSKIGKLMSRLVNDLRDISEFAHHAPENLFLATIILIGSFIILLTINVSLTILITILLVLMFTFTLQRRKQMLKAFRATRETQAELNSDIENVLSGIRLMKLYTNELFEKKKFKKSNQIYQKSWDKAYLQMGIFFSFMNFMIKILSLTTLVYGAYLVNQKVMNIGDLVAFTMYVALVISPIKMIIDLIDQLQKGITSLERFYEIMELNPSVTDGEFELKNIVGEIEFKNVSFSYTEQNEHILNNFSLKIKPNTSVAIIGKTGVGKSTLTKLLPRFYDVNAGEILIDKKNINVYTLNSLRKNIGYVDQDTHIFFGTIKENIMYGNINATLEEVINASKLAEFHDFVMSLPEQYETAVGDRGIKLSGGQKQRISLARVFLKNPPILVLDEATSALDNETEKFIQKAIEKISENRTSIIIAHRLTTIKNVDQIVVLGSNGIIESGTPEELFAKKGEYYRLATLHDVIA